MTQGPSLRALTRNPCRLEVMDPGSWPGMTIVGGVLFVSGMTSVDEVPSVEGMTSVSRMSVIHSSPDREVLNPLAAHKLGVVQVAAVEDEGGF